MVFLPVHPAEMIVAIVPDGAGTEDGETHPQAGYLVAITTEALSLGYEAPFNIVAAKTGKTDRMCNSSLASEANAVAGTTAGESRPVEEPGTSVQTYICTSGSF